MTRFSPSRPLNDVALVALIATGVTVCAVDAAASCGSYVTIGRPLPGVGASMSHQAQPAKVSEPSQGKSTRDRAARIPQIAPMAPQIAPMAPQIAPMAPQAPHGPSPACHGPLCQWQPSPVAPSRGPERTVFSMQDEHAAPSTSVMPSDFGWHLWGRQPGLLYRCFAKAPPAPPPRVATILS